MKHPKLLLLPIVGAMMLASCEKPEQIDDQQNQINQLTESQIKTLDQQIASIKNSLTEMDKVDKSLKTYIDDLTKTASELDKAIKDNDSKLEQSKKDFDTAISNAKAEAEASNTSLKDDLVKSLEAAKADVMAQLNSVKSELQGQLDNIISTIALLQAKDSELEQKISDLRTYVDGQITDTKDWASANFATLSQYNSLVETVVSIQGAVESLNTSLAAVDAKISETVSTAIDAAVDPIKEMIGDATSSVTDGYVTAIANAKAEIEAAYKKEIADAISDVKVSIENIKSQISAIQSELVDMQEQLSSLVSRIQSITYVPRYSDGKAVMNYTNNGTITAGTATFDFALKPASTAAEVAKVWQSAVSMSAVYTITKAAPSIVALTVESVTAENGFLTVTVSGRNLKDDYFLNKCSANVCLCISDGNNDITSSYIQMEPQPVIFFSDEKFKAYCVENFDIDGNGVVTEDETKAVKEIDCSNMGLTSLADIKYFTNLESLNCSGNNLTALDVSNNTSLAMLDVSNNTSLASLHFNNGIRLNVGNVIKPISSCSAAWAYVDGVKAVFFSFNSRIHAMSIDETLTTWGYNTKIGATDHNDGATNTNKIAEGSPAAQWCRAKGSAWYLPAVDELKEIYNNKAILNFKLYSIGGTTLTDKYYWSSTETDNSLAYGIYFSNGNTGSYYKGTSYRVRAVRAL